MPAAIARRLLLEAVAAQAPGDERVVERPDRADVVADRVVAALALGQRADAPAGEEPRAHAGGARRALRLRLVDDPAPEQVPVVRGERVDLAAVGVEREREVLAVLDPEVAVEAPLEVGGLASRARRRTPRPSRSRGEARAADLGVVGVALELARRAREARQSAVAVGDRVPGVLPALVLEAGLLVAALVGDVAVALQVGVLVDPVRAPRGPRARARARASCRRSSARTRRAARRTAASRRRSRSRASGAVPRTRSSRRSASRGGSGRGPRRGSRRRAVPCRSPSARSVVAASSGANGSACRLVKMLSRPNMVMNQGRPGRRQAAPAGDGRARTAARRDRRGCAGRSRFSESQSHSSVGRAASQRLEALAPCSRRLRPARLAAIAAADPGERDDSSSVDHSPCGSMRDRRRSGLSRRPSQGRWPRSIVSRS